MLEKKYQLFRNKSLPIREKHKIKVKQQQIVNLQFCIFQQFQIVFFVYSWGDSLKL